MIYSSAKGLAGGEVQRLTFSSSDGEPSKNAAEELQDATAPATG